MELWTIALIVVGVLVLGLIMAASYFLPFSVLYGLKIVGSRLSTALWPVYIMVRRKGWYTVAAFVLVFSNFLFHLYSLATTQKLKYWDIALGSLRNTFTSSLAEIVQSGRVLLAGPDILQAVTSLILVLMAVSKIYFWFISWNFLKRRVEHFAFWLLAAFCLLVLIWGGEGSEPLFQAFDFMKDAGDILSTVNGGASLPFHGSPPLPTSQTSHHGSLER